MSEDKKSSHLRADHKLNDEEMGQVLVYLGSALVFCGLCGLIGSFYYSYMRAEYMEYIHGYQKIGFGVDELPLESWVY